MKLDLARRGGAVQGVCSSAPLVPPPDIHLLILCNSSMVSVPIRDKVQIVDGASFDWNMACHIPPGINILLEARTTVSAHVHGVTMDLQYD